VHDASSLSCQVGRCQFNIFFVKSPVCYASANFLSDTLAYAQDDYNGYNSETYGAYWERHQVTECMKHHLMHVKLDDVNLNNESVIKFIKSLLMNASALKRMTVTYDSDSLRTLLVENDLLRVQWASNHVVLQFKPCPE